MNQRPLIIETKLTLDYSYSKDEVVLTIDNMAIILEYEEVNRLRNWLSDWMSVYRRRNKISLNEQSENVRNPQIK